jgi:hypothetical protein
MTGAALALSGDRQPANSRASARLSSTLPRMDAPTGYSRRFSARAHEMLTLARRYCDAIETSGTDNPAWLHRVAMLLPRLHAAITSVHAEVAVEHNHPVDLDARFELFSHLRELLADRDGYFLAFDRAHDGPDAMTGSLADDLTDIYCELKAGLRAYEIDPEQALDAWSAGYECHWGQHLLDAERHLAALAAARRLV